MADSVGRAGNATPATAPIKARFLGLQAQSDALVAEFEIEGGDVIETALPPLVAERLGLAISVWLRRRELAPR